MNLKTKRPAIAQTMNGPRDVDRLAREIAPTNTPSPAQLQAPPLLADTAGESDLAYFAARSVDSRKRLAFDGEGYDNAAFISVRVKRDPAGKPAKIIRAAVYGQWGRA